MKNTFYLGLAAALACTACGDEVEEITGSDSAATSGAGGSAAATTSGTGGSDVPQPILPAVTGACPEFAEGSVTFSPAGIGERAVQIWMGPEAANQAGPLIFYWHGAGSSAVNEPPYGIGDAQLAAIKAQGGIVAAPVADPAAGQFSWHLAAGTKENDLILADEVVACAVEKAGIDPRRIHSMGMSAGGLNTTQMSYRRSNYIASVVPYSGGKMGNPTMQNEANKFPALIFHGGPGDQVIINFKDVSEAYRDDLLGRGHFAVICDHGNGHQIPTDARANVWQFFIDHPFGTDPSPYEAGLPQGFPSYCAP